MKATLRLAHVGIHESRNRNAGDTLLFEEVRRLVEWRVGAVDWIPVQLWDPFDVPAARQISSMVDGMIIGGGGLLLRDQAGSDTSASGWQWNASEEAIDAVSVPIVVFGIGYNRFRGQPDFDEPFRDNITTLVCSAAFFGLRNSGSIRAVGNYLPEDVAQRLTLQPCPTVFLWQLHPDLRDVVGAHDRGMQRVMRLNLAFDRADHRFGGEQGQVLDRVAEGIAVLDRSGWEVRVTCHKEQDHEIIEHLRQAQCEYAVDDLTNATTREILSSYAQCDIVVGARGHAQMIPFGLHRPIVSLISHDKMAWFLEDLGHPEWGVEIADADVGQQIVERVEAIDVARVDRQEQIVSAQERLWSSTVENLDLIAEVLGRSAGMLDQREWSHDH